MRDEAAVSPLMKAIAILALVVLLLPVAIVVLAGLSGFQVFVIQRYLKVRNLAHILLMQPRAQKAQQRLTKFCSSFFLASQKTKWID